MRILNDREITDLISEQKVVPDNWFLGKYSITGGNYAKQRIYL